MRFLALFLCLLLVACQQQNKPAAATPSAAAYYPFVPRQRLDFSQSAEGSVQQVLKFWKAYETGSFLNFAPLFADTVQLILPDLTLEADRIKILSVYQDRRNRYSALQNHMEAWKGLRARDSGEDRVLVWSQMEVIVDGKPDALSVHQVWKLDTAGKVYSLHEYHSRFDW
jgi:hypothetical protein